MGSPAPRHPRSDLTNATGQGAAPRFHPAAACSSASTMVVSPLPAPRTWQGDTAGLQDVPLATATVPTDNQSFLVNTDCPVLLLLSHLRSKVGVPATGELRGQRAGPHRGSPCGLAPLGRAPRLFQTSSMCATSWAPPSCSSRSRPYGRGPASSCQRPAPTTCAGWSWAPPVGAEPPLSPRSPQGAAVGVTAVPAGTAQELASRTFTPLLKDPSVALIGG